MIDPDTHGWCGTREIDPRWFKEWVAYGLAEFERLLANDARYREWCQRVGRRP